MKVIEQNSWSVLKSAAYDEWFMKRQLSQIIKTRSFLLPDAFIPKHETQSLYSTVFRHYLSDSGSTSLRFTHPEVKKSKSTIVKDFNMIQKALSVAAGAKVCIFNKEDIFYHLIHLSSLTILKIIED